MANKISLGDDKSFAHTDKDVLEVKNIGSLKYIIMKPVKGEKNADAIASVFPNSYKNFRELEHHTGKEIKIGDIVSLLVRYYNCIRWRPYQVLKVVYAKTK